MNRSVSRSGGVKNSGDSGSQELFFLKSKRFLGHGCHTWLRYHKGDEKLSRQPVLKPPRIVKIQKFEVSQNKDLVDVSSLKALKDFAVIYEGPKFFWAATKNMIYRARKQGSGPYVLKAETISLNPYETSLFVDFDTLVFLAAENEREIWELSDCYVLLGGNANVFSVKKGVKSRDLLKHFLFTP